MRIIVVIVKRGAYGGFLIVWFVVALIGAIGGLVSPTLSGLLLYPTPLLLTIGSLALGLAIIVTMFKDRFWWGLASLVWAPILTVVVFGLGVLLMGLFQAGWTASAHSERDCPSIIARLPGGEMMCDGSAAYGDHPFFWLGPDNRHGSDWHGG